MYLSVIEVARYDMRSHVHNLVPPFQFLTLDRKRSRRIFFTSETTTSHFHWQHQIRKKISNHRHTEHVDNELLKFRIFQVAHIHLALALCRL